MRNKHLIQSASIQAERLYNFIQELYMTSCDDGINDETLDRATKLYRSVLVELKSMGVHGVLINGTFRDLTDVEGV